MNVLDGLNALYARYILKRLFAPPLGTRRQPLTVAGDTQVPQATIW